jgi:hypothetical protein
MTNQSQGASSTPTSLEAEVSHLRRVISTAKVVVALTAAIAATFVAGTLQVEKETYWDHTSAVLMIVTLGLSFWLVTRPVPPHSDLETAFKDVKKQADRAHCVMQCQVIFSALSCLTATVGLLWPCSWH